MALFLFAAASTPSKCLAADYTSWVSGVVADLGWQARMKADAGDPVKLRCVPTPGKPRYIGAEHAVWLAVPLARAEAVLEDFEHYGELSPGFKEIRVTSRAGERVRVFWEKRIAFFLVPNLKYETLYRIDRLRRAKGRVTFSYTLHESSHLRAADGFVVLEAAGPSATRMYRYDFIDPTRGVFQTAPVGKIWHDTFEDLFLSDETVRLRAEHPDWSAAQVVEIARRNLSVFQLETAVKNCGTAVL